MAETSCNQLLLIDSATYMLIKINMPCDVLFSQKQYYIYTVLVTRNFTKSDEIRGNSARNPQSFCAAIRGMILRYPRNDTSLSAE